MKTSAAEFLVHYGILPSSTVSQSTTPAMHAQFTADRVRDLLLNEAFCDVGEDEHVRFLLCALILTLIKLVGQRRTLC